MGRVHPCILKNKNYESNYKNQPAAATFLHPDNYRLGLRFVAFTNQEIKVVEVGTGHLVILHWWPLEQIFLHESQGKHYRILRTKFQQCRFNCQGVMPSQRRITSVERTKTKFSWNFCYIFCNCLKTNKLRTSIAISEKLCVSLHISAQKKFWSLSWFCERSLLYLGY